jgi:hypothetical protein
MAALAQAFTFPNSIDAMVSSIPGGVVLHASGGLVGHEELVVFAPILPVLLLLTILGVNLARSRGLLDGYSAEVDAGAPLTTVAAALSLGAGGIHFASVSAHLDENLIEGILFLAVGWLQLVWAMACLIRPGQLWRIVGAAGNGLVVGVWMFSRTIGLPIGEQPWTPQPIAMADLFATSFEIVLISLLVAGLVPRLAQRLYGSRLQLEKAVVLGVFSVAAVGVLAGMALLTTAA